MLHTKGKVALLFRVQGYQGTENIGSLDVQFFSHGKYRKFAESLKNVLYTKYLSLTQQQF